LPLTLFDLDHTLLNGDSDQLWCAFLIEAGLLPVRWRESAIDTAARYTAGTISPPDYCGFFAGMLAGFAPSDLLPIRERFLQEVVRPLIPDGARALLARHRQAGDLLVLTTATNRIVSELTAADLGVDHYLCTELEVVDGRLSGRTRGTANMGTGKLARLREWLEANGEAAGTLKQAVFYSDSINDLSLLSVVGRPVVVDPDPRLEATALRKRWTVMRLHR